MKINIIYYSSTGNTEEMANLIANGAKQEGAEVNLIGMGEASVDDVKNCDIVLLGGPAMGAENLEESEVEPFVESIEGEVSGKKMVLFGSFGWGGGAYMTEWEDRMEENGAELLERAVVVQEAPAGDNADKLVELGKKIAK
ncbi:MAG: flavodoxin [Clostridium sp.]|uniref:flavodoxin n=1 Tax=Clostridium sp. TaxID=1506 RepID=UPI003F312CCA